MPYESVQQLPQQRQKKNPAHAVPQRQCIICRARHPLSRLVKLLDLGSFEQPAEVTHNKQVLKRGRYACIAYACLKLAYKGRLVGKAKHVGSVALPELQSLAAEKLLAVIGLARRCGQLEWGFKAAKAAGPCDVVGQDVWFAANDLEAKRQQEISHARIFVSGAQLAQAAGLPPVVAVGIKAGRLAERAVYWFEVWYQTQLIEVA